jgi:hypothetical protein
MESPIMQRPTIRLSHNKNLQHKINNIMSLLINTFHLIKIANIRNKLTKQKISSKQEHHLINLIIKTSRYPQ